MKKLFLSLLFLAISTAAYAVDPVLQWDAVVNAEGYKVYHSITPDVSIDPTPVDVPVSSLADPANPEYIYVGLADGIIHYFAVSAYNALGDEGPLSEETGCAAISQVVGFTVYCPAP